MLQRQRIDRHSARPLPRTAWLNASLARNFSLAVQPYFTQAEGAQA